MSRPDFSNYVAHFTKGSKPVGHADDSVVKSISGSAFDRLVNILKLGTIKATPMPWTNKKAVAFTECPWWSLVDHASQYSPYGVGFEKRSLFAARGGPAVYMRPDLHAKQMAYQDPAKPNHKGFHPELYAFLTPFVPTYAPKSVKDNWGKYPVDYSHEREWRVPQDFKFDLPKVKFVIVKRYEDLAKFPTDLKDKIARKNFIIMEVHRQIEKLWPTHLS